MIAVELTKEMEEKISQLAKRTGKTATVFIHEAIEEHIAEVEDIQIAMERLKNPGKRISLEEAEKELGLDD